MRDVLGSARESLLLERATRTAARYPEATRTRLRSIVREGHDAAVSAERAACDADGARAVELYAEAALAFMRARLVAEGAEPPPDVSAADLVARFRELPPGGPSGRDLDLDLHLVLAPGSEARPGDAIARAERVVRRLRTLVEPRGVVELRFERRARVGAVALVLLALIVWPLARLLGEQNVALHKPVTTSGTFPGTTAPPGGLTDGVIVGAPYGVHTNVSDAPWVEVDLLAVYRIDKVKTYNRGDGYLAGGLPIKLQVSEDHVHYVDVATRAEPFDQRDPWVARLGRRTARYVRLSGPRGGYLALSELEVFGEKK